MDLMNKKFLKDLSRQQIEDRLVRLASFTELNPRPVVEVNTRGTILYVNPAAQSLFPDIQKKGTKHPYLAGLRSIIADLKKGAPLENREIRVHSAWYRQFFYFLPEFNSVLVYGTDVSDRKHVQEELLNSEQRYRMLFEKMNYGYGLQDIIFDKKSNPVDYKFIDINPAFEKLAKLKKSDIFKVTVNQMAAHSPRTKESVENRKKYDEVARTGKPLYLENYNAKTKKWAKIYAYKPNAKQIALIFRDTTKEKQVDEEKNNFISIMSHELRNPLTPILANAQFVNTILEKEGKNPMLKESMDIIEKQAKVMADLLNDMLDVARLSHNKIQLDLKKTDVREVVKSSVEASMPFINAKNQKISVFFSRDPLLANVDSVRIEQILLNLINNASKYTQEKGEIQVRCQLLGKQIKLLIKDNGVGMDTKKISRIFELFSDDSEPFMGIGGLGIGLTVVKNLVTMHGGKIAVKSAGKNKGSEFIVTLPAVTGRTMAVAENTEKAAPKTQQARILIVEDNKDISYAIAKILSQQGFKTKVTDKGRAAIQISRAFKPDAALVDIGLPDINGYKVAKTLREIHGSKPTLIAFTGYGQAQDKALAKEAGFDHHVTKPVDINQLIKLMGGTQLS